MSILLKSYQWYLQAYYTLAPQQAARRAYQIFAKPRPAKVKPQEQAALAKASLEQHLFQGLKIQLYRWAAKGAFPQGKILLVHGWNGNAGHWGGMVSWLVEAGYEVVAFDQVGHHRSEGKQTNILQASRLVAQLAEREQPQWIFGHSFGSGATALALRDFPALQQQIRGLVLLSSPDRVEDVFAEYAAMMQLNAEQLQHLTDYVERRFQRQISSLQVSEAMAEVSTPTLLLHDEHDRVLPFAFAQRIKAAQPAVDLRPLQKLGHYKMLWHPTVQQQVAEFIGAEVGTEV